MIDLDNLRKIAVSTGKPYTARSPQGYFRSDREHQRDIPTDWLADLSQLSDPIFFTIGYASRPLVPSLF
jgi:hypothetical protein